MELNHEVLLSAPVQDNEIFELLERLAATEEMFRTPVSTIRDVAELTEASPNLIARILGDIRGAEENETLIEQIRVHDLRIAQAEKDVQAVKSKQEAILDPWSSRQGAIVSLVIVLSLFGFIIYWYFRGPK